MIDTWKCDMCGREQYDKDIEVITYPLKDILGAERNLKYCRENTDWHGKITYECRDAAYLKSKSGTV